MTEHDERSDDELMAACAQADSAAFAVLVARHEARLRLFLLRSLPPDVDGAAEARDLAQDVFVEVWQRRARYQARGFFVAWLLKLARSRATSRGRALAVRRLFASSARAASTMSSTMSSTESSGDGLEQVLRREESERVRAALATLPRKTREALTLRTAWGLSHAEIAAVTGDSEGAVRVRVHRGLAILEEKLREPALDVVPVLVPVGER